MNSRYNSLRTLGTLAIVLAWILLIVGIIAAFAGGVTISGLVRDYVDVPGALVLIAVVPALLFGIGNFLQFFVIGKILHLLVGLNDQGAEIFDELKRQGLSQQTQG